MNAQFEVIKQWIVKGDHDLGTAKITYIHIPEYLDTVTFHCQQAVEKYLKGYLIFLNISFKKTHDLVYLIDLITTKDIDFNDYYDTLSELESYAVEVRYPNETIYLTNEKIESTLIISKAIRDIVMKKMKIEVEFNEIINK